MDKAALIQSVLKKIFDDAKSGYITNVYLALGETSEIDPESVQKYWEELSKGTLAERANLHFRFIKAEVQCMACFQKYHPHDGKIHCPYCGSYGAKVLSGEEFHLESFELDDE